jgi:CDP-diglyceride synthetase
MPFVLAILSQTIEPILSVILMFVALVIVHKYEKYFINKFEVRNFKIKYLYLILLGIGYMLIATYFFDYRVFSLMMLPILSYVILYSDLKRMDKNKNL